MNRELRSEGGRAVTTSHTLLTGFWAADVEALEAAIGRFTADQPLTNDCRVSFFELAGDSQLHVNVTHQHPTKAVRGWAGPGITRDGFVHNRRFSGMLPSAIIRHIRTMVFAATDSQGGRVSS